MPEQPSVDTLELVRTLADFDPVFLGNLRRSLEGWIASNAKGPASLVWMTPFCRKGYGDTLRELLLLLPTSKLKPLAVKFDRFNSSLDEFSAEETALHIVRLASGEVEPALKPKPVRDKGLGTARPKKAPKAPKLAFSQILALADGSQREEALGRLTENELKSGMHEMGIDSPSKAKKAKLVQIIQNELNAGWPRPRSVLDTSRY
jgi:hypothetical protein